MADELETALEAAFDKMQVGDAETSTAPDATPEPTGAETADAEPVQGQPAETADAEPEKPEEKQEAQPRDEKGRFIKAPSSWTVQAKEKWESLDPEIQAEVDRRESDFHKGIEQYKVKAEQADTWEKAVSPYLATIRAIGVEPQQAVSNLMAVDHALRYGQQSQKLALLSNLAQQYDIDLSPLFKRQEEQPYVDPEVAALKKELGDLRQTLQAQAQAAQQQSVASLQDEFQKFQSDPANEHFEAVRGNMAVLLRSGAAKDLKDAYDQAVWANPETRQILLAKQQEQARQQQAKTIAGAKAAAAVNIPRRGAVPSMPSETKYASLDEMLDAKAHELGIF